MSAKVMAYLRKVYAYQDEWLAKNPGKVYDGGDDEHSEFYAQNEFPVSEGEISQARIDMAAERRAAEKVRPLEEKVTAMETERVINAAAPQIGNQFSRMVYRMVDLTDPEIAKLLKDASGNVSFGDDKIALVEAHDPIAKAVLDDMANTLRPMIVELEKTAVPGANYQLNPQANPIHAEIARYQEQAERDLSRAPANVRIQDGKEWVSIARMASMRNAILSGTGTAQEKQAKLQDLNLRHWCLTVDHLEELIAHDLAQAAKKQIERADTLGKKKYGQGASRPAAPAPGPTPAAPAKPAPAGSRPRSPSSSSPSDIVTTPQTAIPGQKSFGEQIAGQMFS
jgi:hypothetical protein